MSAGDLEDLGSPLPSYPTLPASPPKSGQQYQQTSNPTAGIQTSALGVFDPLPTGWSMTAGSNVMTSTPQQQHPQLLHRQGELSDLSQWLASNEHSQSSNSAETTPTNVPIYATVKKPSHKSTNSPPMQHSNSARQRTTSGSPFAASTPNSSPVISSTTSSLGTETLRMTHLEDLCRKLTREKKEMEEEFGRQRKSFMNQMAQCDGRLSQYKHTAEKYSKEVQELSKVLLKKDEELQNVTIAAGITEATVRERFDADRVKYEEEIASLRKIVSVQSQDTDQAMELEREGWQKENTALRAELEKLRKEKLSHSQHRTASPSPTAKSPSPILNAEEANLEMSMIKAAADTELLRSVVLPLEEEIKMLKEKLKEKESKEQTAPSAEVSLIDFETSLGVNDSDYTHNMASPIPSDVRELQNQLRLARAACSDLEMHTSQLKMQKNLLQEEIKSLSQQLTEVSTELEVAKLNCKELQKTWKLASDHFIVAQDKLRQEIYRLHQKLERGEATSPLREIDLGVFPVPAIVERSGVSEGQNEATSTRTHKRSWSTDESEAPVLTTPATERLSSSWSSLHKSSEVSSEDTETLSKRTKDLEEELLKVRQDLLHQKRISANYEKQLPRVQEQLSKDMEEKEAVLEKLKVENDKFKAHVMRQQKQYENQCRKMEDVKEEMKTRIENFQSDELELKSQLKILRDKFTEIKHDTQREIARMNEERREVCQQLEQSREELEVLKTIQRSSVTDYQAQMAHLKQTTEETDAKLSHTTAQWISTRDQLQQVREMLNAERYNKEMMSTSLNSQLVDARKRIDELTQLASNLEAERTAKEEAILARNTTEQKSREFISDQQALIDKLSTEKERAESQVQELHAQVASLKFKLNHTEQTQKDFVELSQSLQMRLADMEEEIQKNHEVDSLSSPST